MRRQVELESGRQEANRRCVALCLLLSFAVGACATSEKPRPINVEMDLHDPDPSRRTQAIERVVRQGERRYVPELIDLLDDRDEAVRLVAGGGLGELTGRSSNYRAFAPRDERLVEIAAWRAWYDQSAGVPGKERGGP